MTTKQSLVRVWGLGDWASYYGSPEKIDPRVEEILLGPCPFHKGKRVFETHFAFMGMPALGGEPLTVAKWIQLHPPTEQPKFYFGENSWHAGQPHTDVAVLEPRLYVLLREIVPGSTRKTPEAQAAMLPPEYEIPTTLAEVTKSILVFRKTGKRCNGSRWAACSERTVHASRGDVSCVGFFTERGFCVGHWHGRHDGYIGVGASRKLEFLRD